MDSIVAYSKAVESSFMELSKNTLDSDVVKVFLSLVKALIDVSSAIGGLNVILGITLLTLSHFNKLPTIFVGLQTAVISMGESFGFASKGAKTLLGTLGTLLPVMALMAVTEGISRLNEWSITLEEQRKIVSDLTTEIESLQSEYDKLNNTDNRTEGQEQKLQLLQREIELKERLLNAQQLEQYNKQFGESVDNWERLKVAIEGWKPIPEKSSPLDGMKSQEITEDDIEFAERLGKGNEAIDMRIQKINQLTSENNKYADELASLSSDETLNADKINDVTDSYDENTLAILEQANALQEVATQVQGYIDSNIKVSENQALLDSINASIDGLSNMTDATGDAINATNDLEVAQWSLADVSENLKNETELLSQAWKEQDSDGGLSVDTIFKMIDAGSEYLSLLQNENGIITLNKQGAMDMFEVKKQIAMNDIQLKKKQLESELAVMEASVASYNSTSEAQKANVNNSKLSMTYLAQAAKNAVSMLGAVSNDTTNAVNKALADANNVITNVEQLNSVQKSIQETKKQIQGLDTAYNVMGTMTLPQYTGTLEKASKATKKASQATSELEKESDKLKKTIDGLKEKLSQQKDVLKETEDAYKAMQEAIEKQLEKEIGLLEDKMDLIEKQKKIYEAMQDVAKEQIDSEIKALEDKMKALDEEEKKEDEILKIQEAQLEVKKAQEALENAKNNKNTRVYSEDKGWQYEANPKSVSDASTALEEALKKLTDLQKEYEKAKDKANLQGQIDELKKLSESWGQNMDSITDDIKNHEDVLDFLKEFQEANLEEREKMLVDFTANYKKEVVKNNEATQSEIDKLKDLKDQWSKSMDIQTDLNKYAGAVDWLKKFENASYEERKRMLSNFTTSWKNEYNSQISSISDLENKISGLEKKLNGMKDKAKEAKNAVDALNSTPVNNKNFTTKTTDDSWVLIRDSNNNAYQVHMINGKEVERKLVGKFGGTANNPSYKPTGGGNTSTKYASGGVAEFGTTGIVDWTGAWDSEKQVDGTKSSPEVILNAKQATSILYQMSNQKAMPRQVSEKTTTTNNSNPVIINELNITANNDDTFDRIITQAQQQAQVFRR